MEQSSIVAPFTARGDQLALRVKGPLRALKPRYARRIMNTTVLSVATKHWRIHRETRLNNENKTEV
jgi:hypothetical protein